MKKTSSKSPSKSADDRKKILTYGAGKIRLTDAGTYAADVHVGGSRKRKSFETLTEAKDFIDAAADASSRIGAEVFGKLSAAQASDALNAFHLLRRAGCETSLYSIVQTHLDGLARSQGAGADVTVGQVFRLHMDDLRARRRGRTVQDKENRLRSFVDLYGGKTLADMKFADVSAWLESTGHAGRTLRNDQIAVQSLFNWADTWTRRRAMEEADPSLHWQNEVAVFPSSAWEQSDKPQVGTVSNADALAVLHRMEEADPKAALVLALGLLAGLRTAEIVDKRGLCWEDIDLTENEIHVSALQSKTKHGRTVPICPSLRVWLVKYRRESGRVGLRFNAFRKQRSAACEAVGVVWPHNAARHTFASNFCKLHGERAAADALGHVGSVDMLLDHYRGVMQSKAGAQAYFDVLTPAGTGGKVVQLSRKSA